MCVCVCFFFFFFFFFLGGGGGGESGAGWAARLKPNQYARLSNQVKYKNCNYLHNVEHGKINILKNVNKFLSTKPTTLILRSPVSEFGQRNHI